MQSLLPRDETSPGTTDWIRCLFCSRRVLYLVQSTAVWKSICWRKQKPKGYTQSLPFMNWMAACGWKWVHRFAIWSPKMAINLVGMRSASVTTLGALTMGIGTGPSSNCTRWVRRFLCYGPTAGGLAWRSLCPQRTRGRKQQRTRAPQSEGAVSWDSSHRRRT